MWFTHHPAMFAWGSSKVDPDTTPARPSASARCPRAVRDFVPAGLRGPDCYCPEAKIRGFTRPGK